MNPVSIAETFDERWARWQQAAAVQDRFWRRAAFATATVMGGAVLVWLAVAVAGI